MDPKIEVSKEAKFQAQDLELASNFADEHSHFNRDFLDSLQDDFDTLGYLTERQYQALTNIIEKWRMEEWAGR